MEAMNGTTTPAEAAMAGEEDEHNEDTDVSGTILTEMDDLFTTMGYGQAQHETEPDGILNVPSTIPEYGSVADGPSSPQQHERRHRRGESVADAMVEAIMDEMQDVKESLVEELEQAEHHTESFFLDMGLTRGLSIMPSDIVHAAEATAPPDSLLVVSAQEAVDPEKESLVVEPANVIIAPTDHVIATKPPITAYFQLASAVMALSAIGPLLQMQGNVNPVMKIFWRMNTTAVFLFPFAVRSVLNEGVPSLSIGNAIAFGLAAGAYASMCTCFVIALQYTTVGNAVILSNSQALLLLVAKLCTGDTVLWMEGIGAVVAFVGAALCSKDSADGDASSPSIEEDTGKTLRGDVIALGAALAGVCYLVLAKKIRSHVSLYVFMFLIMGIGSSLVCAYMNLVGIEYSIDRHIHHGLWGWMNFTSDRLPLELTMVLFCNFCGTVGYVRAMHHFDNLVISVAALLEPVVAELMAATLGVSMLPGLWGWTGNFLVAAGTFAVVYPSATKGASHH